MNAYCDVLITQYSSTVFVGVALGKEVHSYNDLAEVRCLLPQQNSCAQRNIAAVCRELLQEVESAALAALSAVSAAGAAAPTAARVARAGRERWAAALPRLAPPSRLVPRGWSKASLLG